MRSASVGFQCPSCVAEGQASVRRARTAFGGQARRNPEVVWALLGLNGLLFVLTAGGGAFGGGLSPLFQDLALRPCLAVFADGSCALGGVSAGEYYRLLTAMFLHFGLIHLALNMYALYLVGPELERALGRLRFAALYLVAGLGGSALSYALGPTSEVAAGASGAVFGLFAAYWVLERRRGRDASGISTMILLNLVIGFTIPNIDWRGHLGGLVAGALVAAALVYAPAGRQRAAYQVLGVVAVAVLVVAVVAARTVQLTA